jgi:hypothetical protein
MRATEGLGKTLGGLLAPLAGAGSLLRRARIFHPEGAVYTAEVVPLAREAPFDFVAARLEGPAPVRLSTAWWKHGHEWPDLLGCAVRFRDQAAPSPYPAEGDQDLPFATLRSPLTLPLAVLSTRRHDFLMNDYFALSLFEVAGVGMVRWRLVGPRVHVEGRNRGQRLDRAVQNGVAVFRLEARGASWVPVARIELRARAAIDQQALLFSPFRTGRGIEPRGFLHALRVVPYRVSHWVRSRRAGLRSAAIPARAG